MTRAGMILPFAAILMAAGGGCTSVTTATPYITTTSPRIVTPLPGLAAVAAVAYLVTDPLAPNWEIEETKLGNGQYRLAMRMKRFAAGGTGEARQSFRRRATQLAHEGGYGGYQIVSFSEGVEFAYPSSQRVSEGVIELIAKNSN